MTNTIATSRQWYDTTWLVIVLCIFIFPVGLYALWKSEKFAKGWKIAGTAVVGLFIIALFSETGEARENSQKPATKKASANENIEKAETYLFRTTDDFKAAFNQYAASGNLDFHITDLNVEDGEVQNIFQYRFNEHLGILGAVNKLDGSVKGLTMIGAGDGTAKSGGNIILCMVAIIATVDTGLKPDDRMEILKELGLIGDKDRDILNLSTKTVRNGIDYSINSSAATGFIFGASRK